LQTRTKKSKINVDITEINSQKIHISTIAPATDEQYNNVIVFM